MKESSSAGLTPLMQQYSSIKKEHPNSLLLFQVGDFYELFFEDAQQASSFLGITLTKRGTFNNQPIPLCGVPVHALDHYLAKLIKGGFNVVLCDQLEEARPGKMVKRGVTQVLTPGSLTDSKLLDAKKSSYCLFFSINESTYSLIFLELLTGQLFLTHLKKDDYRALEAELCRFFPDEIIIAKHDKSFFSFFKKLGYPVSLVEQFADQLSIDGWVTQHKEQFLGEQQFQEVVRLFFSYIHKNNEIALEHIKDIHRYSSDDFLLLDAPTQRNLELVFNNQDGSTKNSLFALLDQAVTSMGSRMIKKWILRPLLKQEHINNRLDAVEYLVQNIDIASSFKFHTNMLI